jgi:lipopolysaccharide biosynthesis glycosyltransferase
VLHPAMSEENQQRIAQSLRPGASVRFIAVEEKGLAALPMFSRLEVPLSNAALFRLFIPDLLPAEVSRALYLDCDMVMLGEVQELWETDLRGQALMAVQDHGMSTVSKAMGLRHHRALGIPGEAPYFNSGLLLMDLQQWRAENLGRRVLEYLQTHPARFVDQDALNATLWNRWAPLDPAWNEIHTVHAAGTPQPLPKLVHFTAPVKPWAPFCFHPRRRLFFEYLQHTAWKSWRFPEVPPGVSIRQLGYYPMRFEALRSRDGGWLANDGTLLIVGEPGFEPETMAKYVRISSDREAAPLICFQASVPSAAALKDARGGTVMVSGLERLSPHALAELSRVAQSREVRWLFFCAPGTELGPLAALIDARLELIPLREQKAMLPMYLSIYGGGSTQFSSRCLLACLEHDWPENFRELRSGLAAAAVSPGVIEPRAMRLPAALCDRVEALSDSQCEQALWRATDEAARRALKASGRSDSVETRVLRSAEILSVHPSQARSAYQAWGL